jgi:hypothetical protein
MGELVDSRALRAARVVAHAEGEEHQHGSAVRLELEHEDHPEPTIGRRHVDLHAVWKDGAVVAVLGDAAQLCDRDTVSLVVLARCLCGLAAGRGAGGEVFPQASESKCVLARRSVSPTRLRLVVGREHVRLVLAPERLGLLSRRVEQAGALADRLSGGVRHERKLPTGLPVGHDVAAVDVAAELDVRLLGHASMMAGDPVPRQSVAWAAQAIRPLLTSASLARPEGCLWTPDMRQ